MIPVRINGTIINMTIDTGASLDFIDETKFKRMQKGVTLQGSQTRTFAYSTKTQLLILGKFVATHESKQKLHATTVHVVKGHYGCLLGYQSAVALGLIQLHINKVDENQKPAHQKLIDEFSNIFNGIGLLKDSKFRGVKRGQRKSTL